MALLWSLFEGSEVTDNGDEPRSLVTVRAINTTALRAARAWSLRESEPQAWREISRMHGVLLSFLPPGEGPATPVQMIENLRRPMRDWVSLPWDSLPEELGAFPILGGDDELTGEAVEYGSDYTEALFENHEVDTGWIPRWATQTFEKVERSVYTVLVSAGQEEYAATRQLLVEVPAAPGRSCGTRSTRVVRCERRRTFPSRRTSSSPVAARRGTCRAPSAGGRCTCVARS